MKNNEIEALLTSNRGAKALILGRPETFTFDELARELQKHFGIAATRRDEAGVCVAFEHRRLNPVETEISEAIYARKVPSFRLETLEALIASRLQSKSVLMAIKLSKDQGRIYRLLGNPHIDEALFLGLLKLYEWSGEEDDRYDRDVIMHTLRRYLEIKPNETDLLYSYHTLRRLVEKSDNTALLDALLTFPGFTFRKRGEETTLYALIAKNRAIDETIAKRLQGMRDEKIDIALAANPACSIDILKYYFERNSAEIDYALASNPAIDDAIFEGLIRRGDTAVHTVLLWDQPLNIARFKRIEERINDKGLLVHLSQNERLDEVLKHYLCETLEGEALAAIAGNDTFTPEMLASIYARDKSNEILYALALNPRTPKEILCILYERIDEEETIALHLAFNPATDAEVLRRLFEREEPEINEGLAKNPATPDAILEALRLEGRYQNALAENPKLIEAYEKVFDYDAKAIL